MALDTYDNLKSAVLDVMHDNSQEFAAFASTAISLAEKRVIRDTDYAEYRETIVRAGAAADKNDILLGETIALNPVTAPLLSFPNVDTGIASFISLPGYEYFTQITTGIDSTSFLYFTNVWIEDSRGSKTKLEQVDISFIQEIQREVAFTEKTPRYYAINNGPRALLIAPYVKASDVKQFIIEYVRGPDALSSSNQTNIILEKAGDLLYAATLSEMAEYKMNWETKQFWNQKYESLLTSHLNTTRKERRDEGEDHRNVAVVKQTTAGGN